MSRRAAVVASLAAAGVASAAASLSACSADQRTPPAPAPPTLSVGSALAAEQRLARSLDDAPRSLDPQLGNDLPAQEVVSDLFEGLVAPGIDGRPVPAVAAAWDVSADGRTWVFHLRAEACWSNGRAVSAADFVYAWQRLVDPHTGAAYAQALAPLVNAVPIALGRLPRSALGVEATDPRTLTVHLLAPTPYLLELLDQSYLSPVYAPALERYGEDWTRPEHMVSNGAFVLAEDRLASRITLRRNERYWDAAHVRLQQVVYYPLPDRQQAVTRYLAGGLEFTDSFAASQRPWLTHQLGDQVVSAPWLGTYALGLNFKHPPFRDNPALRRALSLSIDRAALTRYLKYDLYQPAYTLLPPLPGYAQPIPDWAGMSQPERNALARRLYRAAGYSDRRPLRVAISSAVQGSDERHFFEAIAAMWHAVLGAEVGVDEVEFKVLLQNRQLQTLPLFYDAWIGDFADPVNFLQLFHSASPMNYGAYANPSFDALLERAARETDAAARYRLLSAAERLLNDDTAYIPLYYYATRHLVKPYLRGWQSNIVDHNPSRYMYLLEHHGS